MPAVQLVVMLVVAVEWDLVVDSIREYTGEMGERMKS